MPASRQFNVTIPSDSNFHNLYTLLLTISGAIPTDGILAKSVCILNISLTGTTSFNIAGSNYANNSGTPITTTNPTWSRQTDRNLIFIPDYYVQGSAATFSLGLVSA